MNLQWSLVAAFLYFEIAVVLLLVLPITNPKRCQKIFRSRLVHRFSKQASFGFLVLLIILILCFLDAVREIKKYYIHDDTIVTTHVNLEMQIYLRLFRAERNFYISGFALFLSLVLRRLLTFLSLLAETETVVDRIDPSSTAGETSTNNDDCQPLNVQVTQLRQKLAKTEKTLEMEKKYKEAVKVQFEEVCLEFDRLNKQYRKVQAEVEIAAGDSKKNE